MHKQRSLSSGKIYVKVNSIFLNKRAAFSPDDGDFTDDKIQNLERLAYRDSLTKLMSTEEYLYFSECKKVSFARHRRKKFSAWSELNQFPIKLDKEFIDVLAQLLYEHLEDCVREIKKKKIILGPIKPEHALPFLVIHEDAKKS